jgi:hypothetical protein
MKNLILIIVSCFVLALKAEEKKENCLVEYKLIKDKVISLCCCQLHRKTGKTGKNVFFQIIVQRANFGKHPRVTLCQEKDGKSTATIELDGLINEEPKTSLARIGLPEVELKNWFLNIHGWEATKEGKGCYPVNKEKKWSLQELFEEAKAKGKKTVYHLGNPSKK